MKLPVKYLIRKRALGDVLWVEPVIEELAKSCRLLIVHTKYNELFQNYPLSNVRFKDKLSVFEKMIIGFAKVFPIRKAIVNLDGSYERSPNQHFLHAYQKEAGLLIKKQYPKLFLSQLEKEKFKTKFFGKRYAVIHPDNPKLVSYRRVNGLNWNKLVDQLKSLGFEVICLETDHTKIPGALYLNTTLRELISLLWGASLFVGIDSGPSHIASALKTPSVLLFGAVNPKYRHFSELFNGIILKNDCCFDGTSHEFASSTNLKCVLNENFPPCTFIEEKKVWRAINRVINIENKDNEDS